MSSPSRSPSLSTLAAVSESEHKRAINAALDLLHRRWVLRILWELRAGPLNFRELQAACGNLSMSVLNNRLSELRVELLVLHQPGEGYLLSEQGVALIKAARPLLRWSAHWARAAGKLEPEC